MLLHATTLAQRFLRRVASRELDHVVLKGLAAESYLNVWIVDADTTDAALASVPLAAGDRWDCIPIGINGGATIVVPLGVPVKESEGTRVVAGVSVPNGVSVGGVVVSLSSSDNATGDLAATVRASYRWIM